MSGEDEASLQRVEAALDHAFADRSLLELALQHSSYANEAEDAESNERLEFLGDAVLGLVIADLLYQANPRWQEGELTRGLHSLVDRRALAEFARKLDIGPALRLGRTEQQSDGGTKSSILADAMEALVGAMYLDGGLEPIRQLMRRVFGDRLRADAEPVGRDPKTRLQELIMAEHDEFPRYHLLEDSGIEGDEERFTAEVLILDEARGQGTARTKRGAERVAAERALEAIDREGMQ